MTDPYKRYYQLAGITIQVESDLPILDTTFSPAIREFEVQEPGDDVVVLRHHFSSPNLISNQDSQLVYNSAPWKVIKQSNSWIYHNIARNSKPDSFRMSAKFSSDFKFADIYQKTSRRYMSGNSYSLTFFLKDLVYLAQLFPSRQAINIHSSAVSINGNGVLFVGHSGAGKTTIIRKFMRYNLPDIDILCDDRNIIRELNGSYHVFGTWNHGYISKVSPFSAPLKAICFLEKSQRNQLINITDKREVRNALLSHISKPFTTPQWWDQTLTIINSVVDTISIYRLESDKSDQIIPEIIRTLKV
jgi:hypothetical protein